MSRRAPSPAWLFHSHAYFDHCVPERVAEARLFREQIGQVFAGTTHLRVSRFHPAPAGPHPSGSFEVVFTRDVFADYVAWLMFTRPEHIDVLVHPLTRSQVLDHGPRALWLGTRRELDPALLEAADARNLDAGRSPEQHQPSLPSNRLEPKGTQGRARVRQPTNKPW